MSGRLIVFELNEVGFGILDWYARLRPGSHVDRLLATSAQWTTRAADEGHLSPWVTWATVHRGVPDTDHGIGHFGQPTDHADRAFPTYLRLARRAGRRVGSFGSLHTHPMPPDVHQTAFWVPDPFAPTPEAHPGVVRSFQRFNLSMSRASARNVSVGIDWSAASRLAAAAPRLGFRPATGAGVAAQLVSERRRAERRVRRRSVQSVLAFDVFDRLVTNTDPDLAVYFTNHVASAMHRYWAATFPADFDAERYAFPAAWVERWAGEIAHAMTVADRMVGRLMTRVDDGRAARLLVMSSMGQAAAQPTPVYRQLYLRRPDALMTTAGIGTWRRQPAMDPHVNVVTPESDRLVAFVGRIRVADRPVTVTAGPDGFVSLEFGQADDASGPVTLDGAVIEAAQVGLEVEEIEDQVASTGYHVPEGSLLLYGSGVEPDAARPEVSTTAIAPAVLGLVDVHASPHHRERSLTLV